MNIYSNTYTLLYKIKNLLKIIKVIYFLTIIYFQFVHTKITRVIIYLHFTVQKH